MQINSINGSQSVNFGAGLSKETELYIATRLKKMASSKGQAVANGIDEKRLVKETISQIKNTNPTKYCMVKITEGKKSDFFNLYSYETKADMKANNWKSQAVVSGDIYGGRSLLEVLQELKNNLLKL